MENENVNNKVLAYRKKFGYNLFWFVKVFLLLHTSQEVEHVFGVPIQYQTLGPYCRGHSPRAKGKPLSSGRAIARSNLLVHRFLSC